VAHYRVSSIKEGSNEQIKDEIDALFFFTLKVLSIRSLYHPDSQCCILRGSAQTAEDKSRARPPGDCQHLGSSPRQCAEPCVAASEFLAKQTMATLPQPPYSPDLACPISFLFPRLKSSLKRHHFGAVKNVQAAVMNALEQLPVQDFQASYDAWQNCWQQCTDAQGCYFEEY